MTWTACTIYRELVCGAPGSPFNIYIIYIYIYIYKKVVWDAHDQFQHGNIEKFLSNSVEKCSETPMFNFYRETLRNPLQNL